MVTKREGLKKYAFWALMFALFLFVLIFFLFDTYEMIAKNLLFFALFIFGISGIFDALYSYKKSEWFYFETVTGKKARIYAVLELISVSILFVLPGLVGVLMNIL